MRVIQLWLLSFMMLMGTAIAQESPEVLDAEVPVAEETAGEPATATDAAVASEAVDQEALVEGADTAALVEDSEQTAVAETAAPEATPAAEVVAQAAQEEKSLLLDGS